ncbi:MULTISPECIES: hypothetical protein [Hyphobacterium]|uniref:Uncharacterized protein n=1 Tax=Hyphobacterium vulgare TaxID=1736751 RepID=A0ABV6ZU65_9PROT
MLCDILKTFPFSRDGVDSHMAKAGEQVDIPDALVPGLQRDRYVKPVGEQGDELKSQPAAPENKALGNAPENKDDDTEVVAEDAADNESGEDSSAEDTSTTGAEPGGDPVDGSTEDDAAEDADDSEDDATDEPGEEDASSDDGETVGVPDEGDAESAAEPAQEEDRAALRAEYTEKFGTKPYNGWDAATLRQKIAEAK